MHRLSDNAVSCRWQRKTGEGYVIRVTDPLHTATFIWYIANDTPSDLHPEMDHATVFDSREEAERRATEFILLRPYHFGKCDIVALDLYEGGRYYTVKP